MATGKAEHVVADGCARAKEYHRDRLVWNVVGTPVKDGAPGGKKPQGAVLDKEVTTLKPHQAVTVSMRHMSRFKT